MNTLKKFAPMLDSIERKIDFHFENKKLLLTAFTHRSYVNEYRECALEQNERLEFLGDAVLNIFVASFLFENYPKEEEGKLSKFRSLLVEASSCERYLKSLAVEEFLLLGKGEKENLRGRSSIFAKLFEALIGAIYLDAGFESTKIFLEEKIGHFFEEILKAPKINYKEALQDLCQKKFHQIPKYEILKEKGLAHEKIFQVAVFIDSQKLGVGNGRTKKDAEQNAAKITLESFLKKMK